MHVLRERGVIKGIMVHEEEFKVSQYADGTTSLVAEDLQSVKNIIKVGKIWALGISSISYLNLDLIGQQPLKF